MSNIRAQKKGFTLVELAIVLVVIGLLIGGILASQSLTETTKVKTFVSNIQQYDIALSNFKTKYNSLPGDSDKFSPAGNNDGEIIPLTSSFLFLGEIANFWVHLQQGGFNYKGRSFSATPPATGFYLDSATVNTPSIEATRKGAVVVAYSNYFIANFEGDDTITGDGLYASGTNPPIATPAFAQAVDKKMDDGIAMTGNVSNRNIDGEQGSANWIGCTDVGTDTVYDTGSAEIACIFLIRTLSQTNGE